MYRCTHAFGRVCRWNRTVIRMIYTRWTVSALRRRMAESYFEVDYPLVYRGDRRASSSSAISGSKREKEKEIYLV